LPVQPPLPAQAADPLQAESTADLFDQDDADLEGVAAKEAAKEAKRKEGLEAGAPDKKQRVGDQELSPQQVLARDKAATETVDRLAGTREQGSSSCRG